MKVKCHCQFIAISTYCIFVTQLLAQDNFEPNKSESRRSFAHAQSEQAIVDAVVTGYPLVNVDGLDLWIHEHALALGAREAARQLNMSEAKLLEMLLTHNIVKPDPSWLRSRWLFNVISLSPTIKPEVFAALKDIGSSYCITADREAFLKYTAAKHGLSYDSLLAFTLKVYEATQTREHPIAIIIDHYAKLVALLEGYTLDYRDPAIGELPISIEDELAKLWSSYFQFRALLGYLLVNSTHGNDRVVARLSDKLNQNPIYSGMLVTQRTRHILWTVRNLILSGILQSERRVLFELQSLYSKSIYAPTGPIFEYWKLLKSSAAKTAGMLALMDYRLLDPLMLSGQGRARDIEQSYINYLIHLNQMSRLPPVDYDDEERLPVTVGLPRFIKVQHKLRARAAEALESLSSNIAFSVQNGADSLQDERELHFLIAQLTALRNATLQPEITNLLNFYDRGYTRSNPLTNPLRTLLGPLQPYSKHNFYATGYDPISKLSRFTTWPALPP